MTLCHLSTAGMCLKKLKQNVEDLPKYFVVDKVIQFLKCLLPLDIRTLFEAVNYFSIRLVFIIRRIISVVAFEIRVKNEVVHRTIWSDFQVIR